LGLFLALWNAADSWMPKTFFHKPYPASFFPLTFLFIYFAEFVAMFYIRSRPSICFFPRIVFYLFVLLHIYFYSVPYGFVILGTTAVFLLTIAAFCSLLVGFEIPALEQGIVSEQNPRCAYMPRSLGQRWISDIAPLWTVLYPVSLHPPMRQLAMDDNEDFTVHVDDVDDDLEEQEELVYPRGAEQEGTMVAMPGGTVAALPDRLADEEHDEEVGGSRADGPVPTEELEDSDLLEDSAPLNHSNRMRMRMSPAEDEDLVSIPMQRFDR